MKHGLSFAAAAVLLSFTVISSGAEPPADHPLTPLAWLAGSTWIMDIDNPDGPMRVESTFEWAGHGQTLKYVIDFKRAGESFRQYEGLYWWHPGKKQITMLQVDRKGNVTESVVTLEKDGFSQDNQAVTTDGTSHPQRVRVTREGEDAFAFKAMVRRGEEWVDAVAFTYKRQRAK